MRQDISVYRVISLFIILKYVLSDVKYKKKQKISKNFKIFLKIVLTINETDVNIQLQTTKQVDYIDNFKEMRKRFVQLEKEVDSIGQHRIYYSI